MSKKEKKEKKNDKTSFDLQKALAEVNPFLREGLLNYIIDTKADVTSQEKFDKIKDEYGGLR